MRVRVTHVETSLDGGSHDGKELMTTPVNARLDQDGRATKGGRRGQRRLWGVCAEVERRGCLDTRGPRLARGACAGLGTQFPSTNTLESGTGAAMQAAKQRH